VILTPRSSLTYRQPHICPGDPIEIAARNEKAGYKRIGLTKPFCGRLFCEMARLDPATGGTSRAVDLWCDRTSKVVAEKADISIETVRTHIRHIYAKIGVNSREALFATLGPIIG
jgi:hypothetical protein